MQQLSLLETVKSPIEYYPSFLTKDEANYLFQHAKSFRWQQNQIRILGRPIVVPRLECMYGSTGASYLYSGSVELKAYPWNPELLKLRDRLTATFGYRFDICIGNLYRNGEDSIGWHADDKPSMGSNPASPKGQAALGGIASISLGVTRKFSMKSKAKGAKSTHYWLEHGSLLLMLPGCQSENVHQLPKEPTSNGERINLTFRPYVQ